MLKPPHSFREFEIETERSPVKVKRSKGLESLRYQKKRKLYQKSLEKPIFVSNSRKAVGLSYQCDRVVNQRTSFVKGARSRILNASMDDYCRAKKLI